MEKIKRALSIRGRTSRQRKGSASSKRLEESDVDQKFLDSDSAVLKANVSGKPPPVNGNGKATNPRQITSKFHLIAEIAHKLSERYRRMEEEKEQAEKQNALEAQRRKALEEIYDRAARATGWYSMLAGIDRDMAEVWNNDQYDELVLIKEMATDMYKNGAFYPWMQALGPQPAFHREFEAGVQRSMEEFDDGYLIDADVVRAAGYCTLPGEDPDHKDSPR